MGWALWAHSSKTSSKKGAGRRAGHCRHHRQCTCAAVLAEKFLALSNPLLLFGRLILDRRGASADLHPEADFCRSARGFLTSCSSVLMPTSLWRSSTCGRRPIVDKGSPRAAFVVRRGPEHSVSPHRASNFACSTPARVAHASHSPLHPTCTATHHPHCLTPPPRPPFCSCAVRAAACTKHCRRPHAARRPFGRR